MTNPTTLNLQSYELPAHLVQGLVNHLMTRPGHEGFALLWDLKCICDAQDQEAVQVMPVGAGDTA